MRSGIATLGITVGLVTTPSRFRKGVNVCAILWID